MIVEPLLGTRAEVRVVADSPGVVESAVVAEVQRLEAIFSRFDASSELCAYRAAGTTDVPELLEVIDLAAAWQARTGGAFHARAQPLVDLWDQAEQANVMPTDRQVATVLEQMGATSTSSALDLNAIAKGWIADTALSSVAGAATSGWLNLGGDIVHRGDGSVVAGIENPARPYDNVPPLATVELSNESLATSGGAHRWWAIDGNRYPKVVDPRTGRPAQRIASATVIAPDGGSADALATVAVFLDIDHTLALAAEIGAECFLVDHEGSIRSSSDRFRPS